MAAALREEIFRRGFRFTPSPQEAVTYYLPRLIAGKPIHPTVALAIRHADVYACEPGVLAAQFPPLPKTSDRFFFTTCKRQHQKAGEKDVRYVRAAGPGSWSSQRNIPIMDRGGVVKVGELRKLRYKKGGVATDWLMDEYSCCLKDAVVGDKESVLCKIYVSPNAAPDSAARQESAAVFAPPAPPEEPIIAQAAPLMRTAPPVAAESPCPKRMRGGAAATTPKVVQPAGRATSFALPRPCVPHRGVAPSATPSVTRPPALALPPAPVQTRPTVQPGRTVAPAPPRPRAPPQQQQALYVPSPSVARHLPPRLSVLAPPVAPAAWLPVPVASPDPDVPSTEAPAAKAEDDFCKELEGSLLTYQAEEEMAGNPEDSTTAEADDMEQFASSLDDILDVVEDVHDERSAHKELDPFAAASARQAELMCA